MNKFWARLDGDWRDIILGGLLAFSSVGILAYMTREKIDIRGRGGNELYAFAIKVYFNYYLTPDENKSLVVMTHMPQYLDYYNGMHCVQIPTNEPIENVKAIMKFYHCTYLVLPGNLPAIFSKLYNEEETIPGITFKYSEIIQGDMNIEGHGNRLKIYKIDENHL